MSDTAPFPYHQMSSAENRILYAMAAQCIEGQPYLERPTIEDLAGKTVVQLKVMLRYRGLRTVGPKPVLRERLLYGQDHAKIRCQMKKIIYHYCLDQIRLHGPTNHGEKPENVLPYEYWAKTQSIEQYRQAYREKYDQLYPGRYGPY